MTKGCQQCFTDGRVVRRQRPELAMIPAQVLEIRHEFVGVVHVGHDADQRAHQSVALPGHPWREHVPCFGVAQEQVAVEVQRDGVAALCRDCGEVVLQSGRIDVRQLARPHF